MQKPPAKVRSKPKLVHIDPADFLLIKRAAKTLRPRAQTVSYFIVEAAILRARAQLNLPA